MKYRNILNRCIEICATVGAPESVPAFRHGLFVLNNHPGNNQIHIHRGAAGGVLFISIKNSDDGGSPGTPVAHTNPLWARAEAAVQNIPVAV